MKKLIPALALLLVSAVLLATSSFAWFSMNKEVTVTGMSVTTKVDSNLFVTASTAGPGKAADSAFGSYADQIVTGKLQPSSTVDGVNFFYTNNAKADGSKQSGNYNVVSDNTIPVGYKAYVDYVVELKAVNTESSVQTIKINKLNLTYNNAAITAEKAYRVGIFVQAQDGENDRYVAQGAAADRIYSLYGATYFTGGKAVASTTEMGTVANLNTALNTMTVAAGATAYYKVTVRLWLEGEDTSCNNTTFKTLDGDWRLQLGFSIDGGADPVLNITTDAPASTVTLTQTLTQTTSTVKAGTIAQGEAFSAVYTANDGYVLPAEITVTVGGNALTAGTDYTWSKATGVLGINSTAVTGAVVVTIVSTTPTP